jgi:cytochrome c-type biogenesis protein CcmH/NrfF
MLGCHYAQPARQQIASLQAEGKTEQQVIDQFVKEKGLKALAVPPARGFYLLAWVAPYVAVGGGLLLIAWFVRRLLRQSAQVASVNDELLQRYREQMEKDLAKLD